MFTDSISSEAFEQANEHCKELLQDALDALKLRPTLCEAQPTDDLFAAAEWHNKLCLIVSGSIAYKDDSKTLYHYEFGDLLGLENTGTAMTGRYAVDFPVELKCYDGNQFWTEITADPKLSKLWLNYLAATHYRQTTLVSALITPTETKALGFKHFAAGDTIIEEGSNSDTVYSIVEGHAEVFVKEVKVGEVLEDEIFGALSLLTKSPRTASVIADQNCLVMVVPKDQFETMIQTHPRICLSLLENMARQIVALNEQVAASASN